MNRRVIAGLLVIIGITAARCSDKDRIPSGILPREKMEDVLWDMIQADQFSAYLIKDSAHVDLKLERLRMYDQVFLLHGVSRDAFHKSYDYYMAHPELTQNLFDSLLSKGTRLRSEAYGRPSARPAVPIPSPAADTGHRSPVHPLLKPMFRRPSSDPKAVSPPQKNILP